MNNKVANQLLAVAGAVVIGGLLSAGSVLVQGTMQTVPLVHVDVHKLATGLPLVEDRRQYRRQPACSGF